MKRKLKAALYFGIIGIVSGYGSQALARAGCPITLSVDSSTSISDSAAANCVITINNGVTLSTAGDSVSVSGSGSTVTNNGTITSTGGYGINASGASVGSITNTGTINTSGSSGIINTNNLTTVNNSGTISSTGSNGINHYSGTLTNLINTGTLSGAGGGSGLNVGGSSAATLTSFTNAGTMTGAGGGYGVNVNSTYGTISTFNNGQGGNSANAATTALTYNGKLPTNYNIIVTSPTHYGQLNVTNPLTSTTTFGIYAGGVSGVAASTLAAGTYSSVLTGVAVSNITGATSGTYGSYNWSLSNTGTTWNMVVAESSSGSSASSSSSSSSSAPIYTINTGQSFDASNIPANATIILNGGTLNAIGNIRQNIVVNAAGGTITGNAMILSAISGTGRLTVGSGIVQLSGVNTWTGGLSIRTGVIVIANTTMAPNNRIDVDAGGILRGYGIISSNVTVNPGGIYMPGNSPGYMHLQSDLNFNQNSTFQQNIAGTAQANSTTPIGLTGYYSFSQVDGSVVINSGASLQPLLLNLFSSDETSYGSAPYVPKLGDQFRILTAAGGISGRFTTLTQPDGLSPGTQFVSFYNMNNSNSIDLAVIPSSYPTTISSASGNKNAQSVGAALDRIAQSNVTGTSTSAQDSLLYAISGQTSAAGIASYAQSLAGEVYAAAVAVIAQTSQRVQQAVLTRLGDTMGIGLPNSMTTPSGNTALMSAANTVLSGGVAPATVSSNQAVDQTVEAQKFSNGNVWGDLAYQKGNRGSDNNSGGWNSNLYQLVFGSDFYTANGMKLGGGLALSNTTLNPTYGSGTIQQGSVFAYGKMPVQEYVVDAMASIGLNSSDLSRGDVTGLSNGFRDKTISGSDALISLGVSRPFDMDQFRITPYARVTWQIVTQAGVNEGNAASALSVKSFTDNGVRGVLGVAAGSKATNPMTEQYTYRAYVGVGADSTGLLNPTLNASIAGMGTNITTPNAGATFVQAGLYGTAKVSDNAYAYAGLSGEARSGQTLGAVNVGLRIQF